MNLIEQLEKIHINKDAKQVYHGEEQRELSLIHMVEIECTQLVNLRRQLRLKYIGVTCGGGRMFVSKVTTHERETKLSPRNPTMGKQLLKFKGMFLNNIEMC